MKACLKLMSKVALCANRSIPSGSKGGAAEQTRDKVALMALRLVLLIRHGLFECATLCLRIERYPAHAVSVEYLQACVLLNFGTLSVEVVGSSERSRVSTI